MRIPIPQKFDHCGSKHQERSGKIIPLFAEQRGICYLCDGEMTLLLGRVNTATVEHVVPRSRLAPSPRPEKAACYTCNQAKGDKDEEEYRAVLALRERETARG